MELGIVGLLNAGKSTLFNSLTKAGAQAANYSFCTIGPSIGMAAVSDAHIKTLGEIHHSRKVMPTVIEFTDIAGLVRGASKGGGLGNQFLTNIREYGTITHVVHCFEDENAIHVDSSVDPVRNIEAINLELIFTDLEILGRHIAKTQKSANSDKSLEKGLEILKELKILLEDSKPASALETDGTGVAAFVVSLCLLTTEPVIYAANVKEDDLADGGAPNPHITTIRAYAAAHQGKVSCVSAQIEEEVAVLDESGKANYLETLGIFVSDLDRLIAASYELPGLINFLTIDENETHAWTIKKGSKAPQAAGKIHTDFGRGFTRAEAIGYGDFVRYGSSATAKEKRPTRLGDKDYVVQDGDVILFRFDI